MILYVNGANVASTSLQTATISEGSQPVYIGWGFGGGYLDDVRIYNYALTSTQVNTLRKFISTTQTKNPDQVSALAGQTTEQTPPTLTMRTFPPPPNTSIRSLTSTIYTNGENSSDWEPPESLRTSKLFGRRAYISMVDTRRMPEREFLKPSIS